MPTYLGEMEMFLFEKLSANLYLTPVCIESKYAA
jgi:hypothetical protein